MNAQSLRKTALLTAILAVSTSSYAAPKKPFFASLDLGYAFGQSMQWQLGNTPAETLMNQGSGFAYGLNFGYYVAQAHRLKLGYTGFETELQDEFKDKFKFDNTYIHFDYDYVSAISNTMNWNVGLNTGSFSTKGKSEGVKSFDPSGFALGGQLGLEWVMDAVTVGLEYRYIANFSEKKEKGPLGVESKVSLPSVMLFNLNVAYHF